MAKLTEIKQLKDLIGQYRGLVDYLVADGLDYTAELHCVFCSGNEGAESAEESDSGELIHSPGCPINKAEELRAIKI